MKERRSLCATYNAARNAHPARNMEKNGSKNKKRQKEERKREGGREEKGDIGSNRGAARLGFHSEKLSCFQARLTPS